MEYEEDDDISFAKWMSSFWGHNLIDENEKEGRGHKKRQTRHFSERRASLPVRTVCNIPSACLCRRHNHCDMITENVCASRTPSADSSYTEKRSNSIQEFAESFEKQLHFKSKRSMTSEKKNKNKKQAR
uniref:Leukemia NUP98 fusion partner 1 n=1 Tax=Anas zonorhyncha TaxID=75864 RepID=A0A8B9ZPV0_9AVES